jgi:hypothetical protein
VLPLYPEWAEVWALHKPLYPERVEVSEALSNRALGGESNQLVQEARRLGRLQFAALLQ